MILVMMPRVLRVAGRRSRTKAYGIIASILGKDISLYATNCDIYSWGRSIFRSYIIGLSRLQASVKPWHEPCDAAPRSSDPDVALEPPDDMNVGDFRIDEKRKIPRRRASDGQGRQMVA
jgi:hypothetical protein